MSAVVACARCGRERPTHGRGLCHGCYKACQVNGTIDRYATVGPRGTVLARNERIGKRLEAGATYRQIQHEFGVTSDTVHMIARRLGLTRRDDRRIPLPSLPPAPTPPPCVGQTMDFDGLKAHELTPEANCEVEDGLALCATCPLATRQWCLDVMQPQTIGREWQGIAGGVVWSHGRVVYLAAEAVAVAS